MESWEPLVPKLQTLEAQIERNKGRPLLMGRDLKMIRDQPLYYCSTGQTWDDYCRGRFRFGRRAADYYIAAWVTAQLCGVPDDFSPRSLRPLTRLTPEHQQQAWANAVNMTKKGRPSPKDIKVAASKFTTKPMTAWTLRAAHAVHERYFRIGLKKALAGATEEQIKEYCELLSEYVLDWTERHNATPVMFDVETAMERVRKYLMVEIGRWPTECQPVIFKRMAQTFAQENEA